MSKYNLPAPATVEDFYLRSILLELEQLHEAVNTLIGLLAPATQSADVDVIDLREPRKKTKGGN